MSRKFFIRPYRPVDQPAIETIQDDSLADLAPETPDGYFDDLANIDEAFAGGAFLVAEAAGEIAGIGGLFANGEIVRMRVAAAHRRKGIATALLEGLVQAARQLDMDEVNLHTLESQHSARALYEKYGFRESARGELYGNRVIAYRMRLIG